MDDVLSDRCEWLACFLFWSFPCFPSQNKMRVSKLTRRQPGQEGGALFGVGGSGAAGPARLGRRRTCGNQQQRQQHQQVDEGAPQPVGTAAAAAAHPPRAPRPPFCGVMRIMQLSVTQHHRATPGTAARSRPREYRQPLALLGEMYCLAFPASKALAVTHAPVPLDDWQRERIETKKQQQFRLVCFVARRDLLLSKKCRAM